MSLNLNQMIRVTPKLVIENASWVRLLEGRKRFTNMEGIVRVEARCQTRSAFDGKPHDVHTVIVENVDVGKTTLSKHKVRVSCTCHFYKWYGCGDVLFNLGSGFENMATGIMPDERNPSYLPLICKHLIKVATMIKKKGL